MLNIAYMVFKWLVLGPNSEDLFSLHRQILLLYGILKLGATIGFYLGASIFSMTEVYTKRRDGHTSKVYDGPCI